ncbi:MAG: hypothetical protein VKK97_04860, partial [Synechococcaceae cyanobacterium]|nr:hypothetical protein [Synechococcaceae cyanobacterium]
NNWPNLNDFYLIQIANLNTSASNTLEFQDVEFLVTGSLGMMSVTDQPITVWLDSALYGPPLSAALQQGLSDYVTSGNSNQISFGTQLDTPVQSKASFKLTGPVTGGFAPAALLNTVPISLSANGITGFTGAKIRGKYVGSSSDFGGFSAGLAVLPSNPVDYDNGFEPVSPPVLPSTIYGNAYNVPGPLPLAGAGVALGFSRRLRRRIAAAS